MNSHTLVPLRVPELGPSLGKLITGTGYDGTGLPLDDLRHQLATCAIQMAGEARRLAASDEREQCLTTIGRDAWQGLWDETVADVSKRLTDRVAYHLSAEAKAVKMTARQRRRATLSDGERRAINARLGSAGAGLISVLDEIEVRKTDLMVSGSGTSEALEAWQREQTVAARRLEAAWMLLEQRVTEELTAWRSVADEISRWRRELWPVFLVGGLGLVGALWVGLMWGDVIDTPALLQEMLRRLSR